MAIDSRPGDEPVRSRCHRQVNHAAPVTAADARRLIVGEPTVVLEVAVLLGA